MSFMSGRFTVNFAVLLLGAGLVVITFAFSVDTAAWVGLGTGAAAILIALYGFQLAHQGVFQRLADIVIAAVGVWAIVAGHVVGNGGRWLEFSAGAGLAALGAIGLLVRELRLGRGLQVGESRIGPDQFARLSALQRDAGTWS
ncbi:MAG: hypothetical protein ACR2NR_10940 [Solirubrobacteraceae bacterium]